MVQEIIDITIQKGIKFPFEDKDWMSKFGVYCLITIIPSLILVPIFVLSIIPIVNIIALILLMILLPLILVISLYLSGYTFEIIKNIKEGKKDPIPTHKDIGEKFRLGLIRFVLVFFPSLIGVVTLLTSISILIIGIVLVGNQTEILGIILILLGGLLTFISFILQLFITILVIPSMLYIYLETNSIGSAYNIGNIKTVVNIAWREFLILYAVTILGSMLFSIAGQFPCIGFFVMLIGIAYIAFLIAFVAGNIFKNIKVKII